MKFIAILLLGLITGATVGAALGWQAGKRVADVATEDARRERVSAEEAGGTSLVAKTTAGKAAERSLVDQLTTLMEGDWSEDAVKALLSRMSEAELASVIAGAKNSNRSLGDSTLKSEAYRAWARLNPEAALAYARREEPGQGAAICSGVIFGEWARRDPRNAFAAAAKLENVYQRRVSLDAVVRSWAAQDREGVLGYLSQHPELPGMQGMLECALQSGSDFAGRMSLVQQHTSGRLMNNLVSELMQQWVTSDPAAAIAHASSLARPDVRDAAMESAYRAWAKVDIQAALRSAEALAEGSARDKSLAGILEQWVTADPMGAADYVLKLGSDEAINSLIDKVTFMARELNNQEAGDLISRFPDGDHKEKLVRRMVSGKAGSGDYIGAVETLKLIKGEQLRKEALFSVAHQWAGYELADVDAWIRQFPPSPERDAALAGYVSELATRDLEAAVAWVGTFQDESRRQGAKLNIAYQWMRKSPAEASAWMTTMGFSNADRNKIRDALARRMPTTFLSATESW